MSLEQTLAWGGSRGSGEKGRVCLMGLADGLQGRARVRRRWEGLEQFFGGGEPQFLSRQRAVWGGVPDEMRSVSFKVSTRMGGEWLLT